VPVENDFGFSFNVIAARRCVEKSLSGIRFADSIHGKDIACEHSFGRSASVRFQLGASTISTELHTRMGSPSLI
jgi:hypothetical protein